MSKTETRAAGKKAAYISPNIVCFSVEYSLCAGSGGNPLPEGTPFDGGGHNDADYGGELDEDSVP